jgi:putative ABC transport system permease protein
MFKSFQQAVRGLRANPARTLLTTLGIVIGIATVIIVLSAGAGFRSYINGQIDAFGTNFVTVQTKVPPSTKARQKGGLNAAGEPGSQAVAITSLKTRDIDSIKRLPNIVDAYGVVIGQQVTSYKQVSKNAFIFAADAARFNIDKGVVAQGRPYTGQEDLGAAQVAVLGHDIAADLFGNEDPIGKNIRVGAYNFTVIGVYEARGSFGFSNDDQQVFVPLNTAQKKLLGIDYLFYGLAQMRDNKLSEATAADISEVIRANHGITDPTKDDFTVQTQAQGLATFDTILSAVTLLLIAVATISLVVGGVGIMNIMYVVVTERIAEIGLKKALGARDSDILREFLIEAVLLTVGGGILGIASGALVSFAISRIASALGFAWAFSVPISGIVLGLAVAGGIGLIFGVFPARRAAKMDPMEALRYE